MAPIRTERPTERPAPTSASDARRGRRGTVAGVAVVLLIGLALIRFATVSEPAAAPPTAPTTLSASITELEQRAADDPNDPSRLQTLATAYVQRAIETADPAFYALADRALDDADRLAPEQPATLVARGTLELSLHDFDGARMVGERARELAPASAGPLGVLVDAAVELGDYDTAATLLQQMADLRPDVAALSRVSYLRELHGDLPGAIDAMIQAESAAAPGFDTAAVAALLGDLHLDAGDIGAARDAYDRAVAAAPGHLAAEVGLARVEAADGERAAAIAGLEQVTAARPQPVALVLLADLQRASGDEAAADDTDEIVRSLARLQQAAGQVVDLELALFEADRGDDPDLAVQLARAAYEARPENIFVADALAWALHRAGRSDDAVTYARAATRLGTRDPLLRYHAAEISTATGDHDRARDHLEAVLPAPWFSIQHRDAAFRLAGSLGLDVPAAWENRS